MSSILIVDDHESIHEMLDAVVEPLGLKPSFANSGAKALELFKKGGFRIVLTDIKMQPMDGIALLRELKTIDPTVIVILMSGFANVESAKAAMRLGAFDYLTKPFKVDQLMAALNRALAKQRSRASETSGTPHGTALVGTSPTIQSLRENLKSLVSSATIVLIQGESGTQKGAIAETLHLGWNSESDGESELPPLVAVDCASLAKASDLAPRIAEAKGGTLHLSLVEKLPRAVQSEIGALIGEAKSECRIICTAGRDLEALVDRGEFDESLYFRISTAIAKVPSLRERSEDIPQIAQAILSDLSMDDVEISDAAKAILAAYRWPGNYTELVHAVEHAALSCAERQILPKDLPAKISDTTQWPSLADYLADQSREYMRLVLNACQGDAKRAATILKCPPADLAKLRG